MLTCIIDLGAKQLTHFKPLYDADVLVRNSQSYLAHQPHHMGCRLLVECGVFGGEKAQMGIVCPTQIPMAPNDHGP